MSVETVEMFRVRCDGCGTYAEADTDFYAWADADQAVDQAREGTWLVTDLGHWCPGCTTWDEERDALVPCAVEISATSQRAPTPDGHPVTSTPSDREEQ